MHLLNECEGNTDDDKDSQSSKNYDDKETTENPDHSVEAGVEFTEYTDASLHFTQTDHSHKDSTQLKHNSPIKELERKRSISRVVMENQRRHSTQQILENDELRDDITEEDKYIMEDRVKKRSESECSSSSDIEIFPIGLDDISFNVKSGYLGSSEDDFNYSPTQPGRFFPKTVRTKKRSESRGKRNWKHALRLIKYRGDPWEKFGLSQIQTERGIRHRYNPLTMEWNKDDCVLKIDAKPFAHGAMRECFRMKKLSNFSHSNDWLRDSNNYVAKKYIDSNVERDNYFQDVQLQMDAKLWGEEFNRHNPPKKVDIFMMAVIELPDRPGKPLYHVEHYIDGEYIKYNSNSGFVDHGGWRQTPQAFSHFTFERSGHELMVVDIQGVGDLYTDPQIHTAVGHEYGDGNLGTRGMALFFHSHKCNNICESLGLTQFDLSARELKCFTVNQADSITSETRVKMDQVLLCESPCLSSHEKTDFRSFFRQRSGSHGFVDFEKGGFSRCNSILSDISRNSSRYNSECEGHYGADFNIEMDEDQEYDDIESESFTNQAKSVSFNEGEVGERTRVPCISEEKQLQTPNDVNLNLLSLNRRRRLTTDTETSTDSGIIMRRGRQRLVTVDSIEDWMENEKIGERHKVGLVPRPSCISSEALKVEGIIAGEESVLGQIHLDLAKYHETCRFDELELDVESAWFHLKAAADCYNLSACISLSQILTGLLNDVLPALTKEDVAPFIHGQVEDIGLDYMTRAANGGDVSSVLYLARAFDTGLNLGVERKPCAKEAIIWYSKALDLGAEDSYLVQARLAEILLQGGEGLQSDPMRAGELYNEAADSAIKNMKGKLANRYYMLAEEAFAKYEE